MLGNPTDMDRVSRVMTRLALLLLAVGMIGCTAPSPGPTHLVAGHARAGPTCPVVPASPAPGECGPRPVAGAILVIADATGREAARLTTGPDGAFSTRLAAGDYTLTPQPVAGLMGTAPALDLTVSGAIDTTDLQIEYDTGIR